MSIQKFDGELWDEAGYLELVRRTMDCGSPRTDRTGTGTLQLFGAQLKFDLSDGKFPLLTTKQMGLKTILEELLFFVRGQTDNKILQEKKVKIWDGNSSREYLDSIGLVNRQTSDLGPVYGFAWRHFGADYTDCNADYTGKGFDQLSRVIEYLQRKSDSRQMVMSAWNPCDLDKVVLPPCHVLVQFSVRDSRCLDCSMYQRSADLGLGLPFNIASYAALTYLLGAHCGLTPNTLTISIGDAHVYTNHVDPLKSQLKQSIKPVPRMKLARVHPRIESYEPADFELSGYEPGPRVCMPMAV